MSLMDTIKAARAEAEEAGTLPSKKAREEAAAAKAQPDAEQEQATSVGFSRRSAARAKPRREAAGSVHVGEKPASEMTKEEKKAAKQAKREKEDLLIDAKHAVLDSREDYKHTQRIWWLMVGFGLGASVISFVTVQYMQRAGVQSTVLATMATILMAVAYLLIIGAFIYDIRVVRPLRKQADDKILGMSNRKLKQVIAEDEERKAAKKGKK